MDKDKKPCKNISFLKSAILSSQKEIGEAIADQIMQEFGKEFPEIEGYKLHILKTFGIKEIKEIGLNNFGIHPLHNQNNYLYCMN